MTAPRYTTRRAFRPGYWQILRDGEHVDGRAWPTNDVDAELARLEAEGDAVSDYRECMVEAFPSEPIPVALAGCREAEIEIDEPPSDAISLARHGGFDEGWAARDERVRAEIAEAEKRGEARERERIRAATRAFVSAIRLPFCTWVIDAPRLCTNIATRTDGAYLGCDEHPGPSGGMIEIGYAPALRALLALLDEGKAG